jgi:glycosyltransferase involved in cell wall biosynthesis
MRVPFTGTRERIFWTPGRVERLLLVVRNAFWMPLIARANRRYGLDSYDIYHLEGGMSFFRDGRDVRMIRRAGGHVVSNYHGLDLRMRGAIKPVWDETEVHITCEFDLFSRFPELRYMFLPFDPASMPSHLPPAGGPVRICHAPRIRAVKGTQAIIDAVGRLSGKLPVELVLIEGLPHAEALMLKASCHISIDQIADGDMGYGVNSLESLSMGIPTVTNLSPAYQAFIPDHPFALATPGSLEEKLAELVVDPALRERFASAGPAWVERRHHWLKVAGDMHALYAEMGWTGR